MSHFKCSITRGKQRWVSLFLLFSFFHLYHSLQGNTCCSAFSFSENFLQWFSWRESIIYIFFKTRIFKQNVRFLKKKFLCFSGVSNLFLFLFPPLVGHVRRRFGSPEISFKRKYCRSLKNLPHKGNLVSILNSDFNSWVRGSGWKVSSWWIL